MTALITLLAAAEERSHTPFFFVGGALAVYAVLVSVLGFTRPDFPGGVVAARGLMGVGALLVAGTMAMAVFVSS